MTFVALFMSAIAFFTLTLSRAYGQDNWVQLRHYTLEEGLADNNIIDLVASREGYIWLATPRGLSRFDGYSFVNFSYRELPGLFPDNRIDRFYCHENRIFLLSKNHGLLELNHETLEIQILRSEGIVSMSMQGDTAAYFFANGDVEIWLNQRLHSKANYPVTSSSSIVIAHQKVYLTHNLWGILALEINRPDQNTRLELKDIDPVGKVQKSIQYGAIYITGNRVFSFINDKVELIPEIGSLLGINFYNEDDQGNSMFISYSQYPFIQTDAGMQELRSANLNNIEHRKIIKANHNTYLIGTNQGLIQIGEVPDRIHSITATYDRYPKFLYVRRRIVEAPDGSLFFLGHPGILKSRGNEIVNHTSEIHSYYDGVIFEDTLYAATEGSGLMAIDISTGSQRKVGTPQIREGSILFCIVSTSDDRLLAGGIDLLVWYNPETGAATTLQLPSSLEIYHISELLPRYFLVATNKGVYRLTVSEIGPKWELTQHTVETRDILHLPDRKEVWYATREGIFIRNEETDDLIAQLNDVYEVSNPVVTALIRDNSGLIWASTFSGITVVDPANRSTRIITRGEGLGNQEFNFASAARISNGDLIFGGLNAYDVVQPDILKNFRYADDFFISGIKHITPTGEVFTQLPANAKHNLRLRTGYESLVLYLTNFDYAFGSGYTFEYQMNAQAWQKVNLENQLQISNLSYGNHTLKVRMINPMGEISEVKSYILFAQVPWFQQPAFYLLVFASLITALVLTFYFFRRAKEIESDTKTKIAMDLHDEAGSILTRLTLQIATSKNLEEERKILKEDLSEVLYSLRAFITSFAAKRVTLTDLFDDLNELATRYSKPCVFKLTPNNKTAREIPLSTELYRDIKLSVYELINNNLKHSESQVCTISFETDGKLLTISYEDPLYSGNFESNRNSGYGHSSLRKRTQRNHGSFEWKTDPVDGGLFVKLKFRVVKKRFLKKFT